VHPGTDFHLPGHKTLGKQQAPQITEHDAGIDPKWAVHTASCAAGAFRVCCVHTLLQKGAIHIALTLNKFAQGGLNFVRRDLFGVFVVREIVKTALSTQTAVRTDFKPGFEA
jgi:hypothetical protein